MKEAIIGVVGGIIGVFVTHFLKKKNIVAVVICIAILSIGIIIALLQSEGPHDPSNNTLLPTQTAIMTETDQPSEIKSESDAVDEISQEISLFDLEPYTYNSSGFEEPYDVEYNKKDIFGVEYAAVFRGYMEREYKESMTYRLNGEYDRLEATIAVYSESRGSGYKGSVFLFVDDKKVVNYPAISSDFESEKIAIDLSGVKDLKIELYGDGNMGLNGISVLLADPVLYRKEGN